MAQNMYVYIQYTGLHIYIYILFFSSFYKCTIIGVVAFIQYYYYILIRNQSKK